MRISIISTIYNKEKYLEEHIKSVINQDYKDIEFILVNDGSTDNSLEILEKYKKIDNRIKVINQKNQGPSYARRNGFIKSTGDVIYIIDGDDTLYDDKSISKIMKIFKDNKDIDFTISPVYNSYDNKSVIDKIVYSNDIKEGIYDISYLYDKSFRFNLCNKVIKRNLIKESDFENYRYYEDGIALFKVLNRSKKFYYDTSPIYVVNRKNHNNERLTLSINVDGLKVKYESLSKIAENKKFDISIKRLYLQSYLDDLNYALNLNCHDRKQVIDYAKMNLNKEILNKKYLRNESHYKKIYMFRFFYQNTLCNTAIGLFIKFKKLIKRFIRRIINNGKNYSENN